jgi:predicted nuclease of restriction endonuclease-like RecB superfamily
MSIIVRENKFYRIEVSKEKNRAYLKIVGFWKNPEVVPDYLADWTKAVAALTKGFTLLTDASEMKTHPAEVRTLHVQAQAILMKAGESKVAEIIQNDVAEMQLDSIGKATKFPKQNFRTVPDAEKWLDLPA